MPVARKVWQPMLAARRVSAARRWIIRHTSIRSIGRPLRMPVLRIVERKRGERPCLRIRAGSRYSSRYASSLWCAGIFVTFAAFLVQPEPPALAFGVVVVNGHGDHGADPGEGVGHDADQRAV